MRCSGCKSSICKLFIKVVCFDWLQEGLHQAFQQPEMQEEYAEAQRLFRQFDSSGDGLISCDEFVEGLKEITKQVVVKADIPAEQVQFQFQVTCVVYTHCIPYWQAAPCDMTSSIASADD